MPGSSSRKKSVRKSYFRKFGTAHKIETYVNKYLDSSKNNQIKIEDLLRNNTQFTYTAIVDYIRKNRNMYLEYGPGSVIHTAFTKLCKAYEEVEFEPFFHIVRGNIYESKYERPSFREIKCIWVFHQLLSTFYETEHKDFDTLDFIEEKVKRLKPALAECASDKLENVLGIMDFELLLMTPPFLISRSSKTRKNSSRSGLKK